MSHVTCLMYPEVVVDDYMLDVPEGGQVWIHACH